VKESPLTVTAARTDERHRAASPSRGREEVGGACRRREEPGGACRRLDVVGGPRRRLVAAGGPRRRLDEVGGPRRRLVAAVGALAAATALAAGCGSSDSPGGADSDPASAVPARAPVYLEAVVEPEGKVREDALAAARKLLGTEDPVAALTRAFDRLARDKGVTFARDVAPWLGKRVGLGLTSLRDGRTHGGADRGKDIVVVAASADDDAARQALDRLAGGRTAKRSHRSVEYRVDPSDGTAAAVHDGRVIVGPEQGVREAIDAAEDDSLAETDKLRRARELADDDEALGFLFLDVRAVAGSLAGGMGAGSGAAAVLLPALLDSLPETVGARLHATPDALRLEAAATGGRTGLLTGAGATRAVADLPADAWLGVGLSGVGAALRDALDRLSQAGLTAVGVQAFLAQVRERTGLDVRRDLLSWMGDAGLFVSGGGSRSVGGGLVIHATDPRMMRATVGRLGPLARALGGTSVRPLKARGVDEGLAVGTKDGGRVFVAAAGDRFVVALGRRALSQAIAPVGRLGDQAAFRAAAAKLGGGLAPSLYLDVPAAVRLAAKDRAGGRASGRVAGLRLNLDAFGALVGGARQDGDVTRATVVATLR
jgi:hypothetical protein